ncbi:putative nucleotide-diphospho-sugar transferase [Clostridium paridis]|uniref:Nucleotide-diphospho-sugar transferase domain-containing protein n=1 Tax=Clostridium paridis TaxID=2803863 RepID=A0A937K321_9CLOT|nr:putative nucleotide-diphospho-sugar transferase [Clostridium paridis]MBL4931961.1 hypothetical protein [Clostridium paridis]
MPKFHFTSVVSKYHLFKLIALYSSLKTRCSDFELFILCMDHETFEVLSKIGFEKVTLFKIEQLEDDQLLKAKSNRSFHEYCWTGKPLILHHVLTNYTDADYYAHLDADLYFYEDPMLIFKENPSASIFLTDHRNSKDFAFTYPLTGRFNTGFVGCRNDPIGVSAIKFWKEQCIENCSSTIDLVNKTFGDQRYTESWPQIFPNIHIVNSYGVNAAIWNIQDYTVTSQNGEAYLNNDKLVFFHFSGLTIISPKEVNLCWYYHIYNPIILNLIYLPYVYVLDEAIKQVTQNFPWFNFGFIGEEGVPATHRFILN